MAEYYIEKVRMDYRQPDHEIKEEDGDNEISILQTFKLPYEHESYNPTPPLTL